MATLKRDKSGKPTIGEEPKGAAAEGGAMSFFDDDEGENLYSGVVLLDGESIRVRELTAAEVTAYSKGNQRVGELLMALGAVTDSEEAERKAAEIQALQLEIFDAVIERGVSGWDLKRPDGSPVPCTPETKQKLRLSKKSDLTNKIVQRSTLGRDLSSFLAE